MARHVAVARSRSRHLLKFHVILSLIHSLFVSLSVPHPPCRSIVSTVVFCAYVLLSLGVVSEQGETNPEGAKSEVTDMRDIYVFGTLTLGLCGVGAVATCLYMLCYMQTRKEELAFIVREASVACRAIPGLIALPLIPITTLLVITGGWLCATIWFLSQTSMEYYVSGVIGQVLFLFVFGIEIVGMVWIFELISGFADACTAGSICSWYWSKPVRMHHPRLTTHANAHVNALYLCQFGQETDS